MVKVLFVCLGNICRSPMAEAVFRQQVAAAGLADRIAVDSAGVGDWHVGERAHRGTLRVLAKHNIPYDGRARQTQVSDLADRHSYIIALDTGVRDELRRLFGDHPRLYRLLDFASQGESRDVPDPYYSGIFDEVYRLVEDGCRGLLAMIRRQEGL
jgi:protein-tyrosine phosphatase